MITRSKPCISRTTTLQFKIIILTTTMRNIAIPCTSLRVEALLYHALYQSMGRGLIIYDNGNYEHQFYSIICYQHLLTKDCRVDMVVLAIQRSKPDSNQSCNQACNSAHYILLQSILDCNLLYIQIDLLAMSGQSSIHLSDSMTYLCILL